MTPRTKAAITRPPPARAVRGGDRRRARPAAACGALLWILWSSPVLAEAVREDWEQFDLSGIPERPETFLEQQIHELVRYHHPGDRSGAASIQKKLASRYREKGDTERARAADRRAGSALDLDEPAPAPVPAASAVQAPSGPFAPEAAARDPGAGAAAAEVAAAPPAAAPEISAPSAWSGRFYGMQGGTLHTWEFSPDGTFHHAVISAGSGTAVRSGERGRFELEGETIVLHVVSTATGFSTPGVGGRSTQLGGSAETTSEVRRLTLEALGPGGSGGIALDGVRLKPRSW